jgi:hypothetical protein
MRLYAVPYEWGRVLLSIGGAVGLYSVSVVIPAEGTVRLLLRAALAASYFGVLRLAGFGVGRELKVLREWVGGMRKGSSQ